MNSEEDIATADPQRDLLMRRMDDLRYCCGPWQRSTRGRRRRYL
jgi:hypothetical protein